MLKKLIAEIRAGGTLETGVLAARLGTSPRMIQALLEHLCLNGFIQSYSHCGEGCQGCSLSSSCRPGEGSGTIRLWQTGIPNLSGE